MHKYAELPLNYLGYTVQYIDVSDTLPAAELSPDTAAVTSWFDNPLENDDAYVAWAGRMSAECGRKPPLIAFGDPGIRAEDGYGGLRDIFLQRIGISYAGEERTFGVFSEVVHSNPRLIGWETEYNVEPGRLAAYQAEDHAMSALRITPSATVADSQFVDLVVLSQSGAYVDASAAMHHDARSGAALWVVDPFVLFEEVIGKSVMPVPDVTTLNGRRLFFSTVGPEGWLNASPARRFGDATPLGSELLLERLVLPYPDLPVTVSVVTGDLDPSLGGRAALAGAEAARLLFDQPQVEIASSGHSMIRTWEFFSRYDQANEVRVLQELRGEAQPSSTGRGLITATFRTLETAIAQSALLESTRIAEAPRRYVQEAFDLTREIPQALSEAAALAPGRESSAFLWRGDARPFAEALQATADAGVASVGGGGGVYNMFLPALSELSSFFAPVEGHVQVYNALSGDEVYTNHWTSPQHGFQLFLETLDRTENPRRLKPFHLNYSARSAIAFGTRRAIEIALDTARTGPFVPVTAADYAAVISGFRNFRATAEGELRWRIRNRGDLQTARFDDAAALALDMGASSGVLGAVRKGDILYVALNPAEAEPLIALVPSAPASGMEGTYNKPGLSESRFKITGRRDEGCTVHLQLWGYGEGDMTWYGPPNTLFEVLVNTGFGTQSVADVGSYTSGPDGRLDLFLPAPVGGAMELILSSAC